MKKLWYVVVGFGLRGSPQRTPKEAWNSAFRSGQVRYGYEKEDEQTCKAAHNLRLIEATTKRAANTASISRTAGIIANGAWQPAK